MFTFAPALRFVASLEAGGVTSVSSLPGGQSSSPDSPFYINLLGPWLTNESFPLSSPQRNR